MAKASQPSEIFLSYNLFDLPTAQHKAGLAGLLLLIDSMQQRGLGPLPTVKHLTSTNVELLLSQESLQAVFNELYDAEVRTVEAKKAKKKVKRGQQAESETANLEDGEGENDKSTIAPKAAFLEHLYPGEKNGWLKLWQDVAWYILRSQSRSRQVYQERAARKPSAQATNSWLGITQFFRRFKEGELHETKISGSLLVGAQQFNAEQVPFTDRADHAFLLHFWPTTVQVFVPQAVKRDERTKEFKPVDQGYVIAIPEVSHLEEFCEVFPRALGRLDPQMQGYRPKACRIDLPIEGGLEFLRHLTLLAQQKATRGELKYSVSAVEVFHLEKQGNNVKTWTSERIIPRAGLLDQYERIRAFCRNPFFKSQLILNLLRDVAWHEGFERLFAFHPWEFFIHSDATPGTFPLFSVDIHQNFRIVSEDFQRQQEAYTMAESSEQKPQSLEKRIYDMVGKYVRLKAEAKSKTQADFNNKAYMDAKKDVCSDVFLAMRSRRDQDFIEYFTGTICSVPQFLPVGDYVFVSQALLQDGGWEKVKTLSMLALAAHS